MVWSNSLFDINTYERRESRILLSFDPDDYIMARRTLQWLDQFFTDQNKLKGVSPTGYSAFWSKRYSMARRTLQWLDQFFTDQNKLKGVSPTGYSAFWSKRYSMARRTLQWLDQFFIEPNKLKGVSPTGHSAFTWDKNLCKEITPMAWSYFYRP